MAGDVQTPRLRELRILLATRRAQRMWVLNRSLMLFAALINKSRMRHQPKWLQI